MKKAFITPHKRATQHRQACSTSIVSSLWVRYASVLPPQQVYLKFTPYSEEERSQRGGTDGEWIVLSPIRTPTARLVAPYAPTKTRHAKWSNAILHARLPNITLWGECGVPRHTHRTKLMRKKSQATWRDARIRIRVHRRSPCRRHHRRSLLDHHRRSRDAYTACSDACSGGPPDCRRG